MVALCLCIPLGWGQTGSTAGPHSPGEVSGASLRLWAAPRGTKPPPLSSPSLLSSPQAPHVRLDLPGPENKHPRSAERLGPSSGAFAAPRRGLGCPGTPHIPTARESTLQFPFSLPSCRCFRELPKGAAAAKSFIPVLLGGPGALTGYPAGPAAPGAPGAPLSPAKPGFPGMPSRPLVPGTPCKAKKPLRPPKTQLGESKAGGSPVAEAAGSPQGPKGATCSRPHPCRCRTLLSPHPTHTRRVWGVPCPTATPGMKMPRSGQRSAPCGASPHPSEGQLCTYRQPWQPSRTWVTRSALGKEGCSAGCPWKRGPGDWDQGEALLR